MRTDCTPTPLTFEGLGRRSVVDRFDGGRLTTDGGVLLLREVDQRFRVTARRAAGYEDLNDHDRLRADSAFALAGSSTLNRLELGVPEAAAQDRYQRIAADREALDRLLVDLFLEAHAAPPAEIVLDLDATDDPLHGRQEDRSFHGYYGHYCYLPLYVTCGDHVLYARLRPANIDASAGSVDELARIVPQIRRRWPGIRICVRGDAGFCREEILRWCEDAGVGYVFGLARNARLEPWLGKALHKSRRRCAATGRASRRFQDRCESRSGDGSGASGIEVAAVGVEFRRDGANPGGCAPDAGLDRPLPPGFGRREADARAQAATRSIRLAALSRFIAVAFNVSSASTLRQVR